MSVKHALLAILVAENCYGYQLKQELETRSAGLLKVNVGQVYTTLDRLERDGFVLKQQSSAKSQIQYQVLASGQAAAEAWLTDTNYTDSDAEVQFAIKLCFILTLPWVDTLQLLFLHHSAICQLLANLTSPASAPDANSGIENNQEQENQLVSTESYAISASVIATEQKLQQIRSINELLLKAEEILANSAEREISLKVAVNTELPKLGRPHKTHQTELG